MRSAEPPRNAILPASVEASSTTWMSRSAFLSRPWALMISSSQASVPVFCAAMRMRSAAAAAVATWRLIRKAAQNAESRLAKSCCARHVLCALYRLSDRPIHPGVGWASRRHNPPPPVGGGGLRCANPPYPRVGWGNEPDAHIRHGDLAYMLRRPWLPGFFLIALLVFPMAPE